MRVMKRHMRALIPEKWLHEAFEVGVALKGASAAAELFFGMLLLLTMQVGDIVVTMARNELIEDPDNFFATHVTRYSHYLSPHAQFIGALYLLSHGIVKLGLVWGLLRGKMWAYPASLAVLLLFILYQIVQIVQTHSTALILLTVFDFVVLWLIWHEYRMVSAHHGRMVQ